MSSEILAAFCQLLSADGRKHKHIGSISIKNMESIWRNSKSLFDLNGVTDPVNVHRSQSVLDQFRTLIFIAIVLIRFQSSQLIIPDQNTW